MKNNIIIFSLLVSIALFNAYVFVYSNISALVLLFIFLFIASYYWLKKKDFTRRINFFIDLFIALFVFQVLVNLRTLGFGQILASTIKTTLQLFVVTQSIYIVIQKISLTKMLNAFSVLPVKIRLILVLTFSFIPFVIKEYDHISLIQKTRGVGSNWYGKIFGSIFIFVSLIHQVIRRSQSVALAIALKGYENGSS